MHASPDAPAVDIWVNGAVAFSNAPFKGITDYAKLEPGSYRSRLARPAPPSHRHRRQLDLATMTDYTVVAVGQLANIEPLVLIDNNSAPAAGKAHVRFVHASPDAPAVDIAVANGGPVLFANVPFKGVGDYLPVDAGTYDLEARLAGTDTVALSVPGVALEDGTVYTIFAMGLAGGEPALTAVPSVDASYPVPATLPVTGGETTNLWLMLALGAGLALVAAVCSAQSPGRSHNREIVFFSFPGVVLP